MKGFECAVCGTPMILCDSDNTLYCCFCNKLFQNPGPMSRLTRKLILRAGAKSESWQKDIAEWMQENSSRFFADAGELYREENDD